MQPDKGIIVVTGNGKGKTTTALGYAVHFLGQGKKVRVVQFLKGGGFSGELFTEAFFEGRFAISQFGGGYRFSKNMQAQINEAQSTGSQEANKANLASDWSRKAMQAAWAALHEGYDLLVLDEVAHALKNNLLSVAELEEFLQAARQQTLVVLTGRNMHEHIMALSDYVLECYPRKHPMQMGIGARRGIEY